MTAAIQDVLELVMRDPLPNKVDTREAVRRAVMQAAADRHGLVHIAAIRRHLPPSAASEQIGAAMNRLVRRGYLVETGRWEPNGDTAARNGNKPSPVRRLVKPIPPEALQS